MKKLAPLILIAGLALTGCGEANTPENSQPVEITPPASASPATESAKPMPSETDSTMVEPQYAFATGMTFGKLTTDGKPGSELKAFLEGAQESVGEEIGDEFTYWTLKIDNREGTESAFPNQFRAYDDAGKEYLFVRTLDLVEGVNDQLPPAPLEAASDSTEWKEYEKMFDLYEAAFEAEDYSANPGAVKEFVIVSGDDLPSEFAKMTIDLGGLVGEADVITLEDAESQGYPLDF